MWDFSSHQKVRGLLSFWLREEGSPLLKPGHTGEQDLTQQDTRGTGSRHRTALVLTAAAQKILTKGDPGSAYRYSDEFGDFSCSHVKAKKIQVKNFF